MATRDEASSDAAAAKAYAEAVARKADARPEGEPAPPAGDKSTTAMKTDTAEATAGKSAPVQAKPARSKNGGAKTKKAAPRAKTAARTAAPKKNAGKAAARKPATKAPARSRTKETDMAKTQTSTDYAAQMKEGLAELQARAQTAYEKSAEYAVEAREFSKGNLDAMVESGKIFAAGLQEIAKATMEDSKAAVETMTGDAKEFAAVKSPTDFVQLQGQIASRNFDAAVAQFSKATEAWVKLAGDVAAPLSSRVSLAMEKARPAA